MSTSFEYQSLAEAIGVEEERLSRIARVGWQLYESQRFREAAAVFRGLSMLDPENLDLYRGLALAASRDNDLLTAIAALERGERLLQDRKGRENDRGYLLALLAALLYRAGRKREAVERAQQSLEVSPDDAKWVAALQEGMKRAQVMLLRHPAKAPAEVETIKKVLRARLAEVGRGQQTLARALGYQDPELIKVFDDGAALLDAGQPRRASRIFEGLVALDEGVPLFHLALGQARELAGHHRAASDAYDQAVESARGVEGGSTMLADALLRRARHRFKRGRKRSAKQDAEDAMALEGVADDAELAGRARKILRSIAGRGGSVDSIADRQIDGRLAPKK